MKFIMLPHSRTQTRGYTVQHFCKCMKMFPNISLCKTVEAKKDHPYSCFPIVLSNKEF